MELRIHNDDHLQSDAPSTVGRYRLKDTLAVGRVTSVHLGFLEGAAGFRKPVAVKRLLPSFSHDPNAIADLGHEACVLAQIHHPNVVQALDLVRGPGASYLVMDYVLGESLCNLQRARERCPVRVAVAIVVDALRGLEAAHSARRADGQPLRAVHRNVCPQNLLVGIDGVTRVIDFGSALSSVGSRGLSRAGAPDIGYAAPEQLAPGAIDRRSDIFSMGVVLWELLTGKRMFVHSGARKAFQDRGEWEVFRASAFNAAVPRPLDEVVSRSISWSAQDRFATAAEFAAQLTTALDPASRDEVAAYVEKRAEGSIRRQRAELASGTAPSERPQDTRRRRSNPSFDEPTMHFTPDRALLLSAKIDGAKSALFSNVDLLRSHLSRIVEANTARSKGTDDPTLRTPSPWHRHGRPGRRSFLIGGAVVLLLLVGMRLSRETSGAAAAPAAREARPAVREPVQVSPPVLPPAVDIDSLPTEPSREETPREAIFRNKEPIQRASLARAGRSSCNPPFTLDVFGIKRIKLHCL